jgi:hypothetical protein
MTQPQADEKDIQVLARAVLDCHAVYDPTCDAQICFHCSNEAPHDQAVHLQGCPVALAQRLTGTTTVVQRIEGSGGVEDE